MYKNFSEIMLQVANIVSPDLTQYEVQLDIPSQDSSYKRPIFSALRQFVHDRDANGRSLLQAAVEANKPNIVDFLVRNGADVNVTSSNYSNPIDSAITLLRGSHAEGNKEKAMLILEKLVIGRKRITEEKIFELIHVCLGHYRQPDSIENEIYNTKLCDNAVSKLLVTPIQALDFFVNGRDAFIRYIGHLVELNDNNFQGFHPQRYMLFRIRILFQIIMERVLLETSSNNEEGGIYNEFLTELETFWLINIIQKFTILDNLNEQQKSRLLESLARYAQENINKLQNNQEYLIYSGWRRHAICIAFIRDQSQLTIRVDNLGQECYGYHPHLNNQVKPRVLAKIPFPVTSLEEYLKILFENLYRAMQDVPEELEVAVRRIYNPAFANIGAEDLSYGNLSFRAQSVGNCVVASHKVGQQIRLGGLYGEVSSREIGILQWFQNYFDRINGEVANVPPSLFSDTANASMSHYFNSLLSQHYNKLLENKLPYRMRPSLSAQLTDADARRLLGHWSSSVGLSTLYRAQNISCRSVIRGGAGMGKTTLSLTLCQEWQNRVEYRICDKIFYIALRHLNLSHYPDNRPYKLIDIVERECFVPVLNRNLYSFERFSLERCLSDEKIIWLVDGLDELYAESHLKAAIDELACQRNIILTSRPYIESGDFEIDINLQLKNYEDAEIKEFITQFFSDRKLGERLLRLLEKSLQLKNICQAPVILSKLCQLWQERPSLQLEKTNATEINQHFFQWLLKGAFQRQLQLSETQLHWVNQISIKFYFRRALRFSEHLAFNSMVNESRQIFLTKKLVEDTLEEHAIARGDEQYNKLHDELNSIGIVKLDVDGGEFTHLTFQEFFAAEHLVKNLCRHPTDDRYKEAHDFILAHNTDPKYQMVFIYMAGLFSIKIREAHTQKKRQVATEGFCGFCEQLIPVQPIVESAVVMLIQIVDACYSAIREHKEEKFNHFIQSIVTHINNVVRDQDTIQLISSFATAPNIARFLIQHYIQTPSLLSKLSQILRLIDDASCFDRSLFDSLTADSMLNAISELPRNPNQWRGEDYKLDSFLFIAKLAIDYAAKELSQSGVEHCGNLSQKISYVFFKYVQPYVKRLTISGESGAKHLEIAKKLINFCHIGSELLPGLRENYNNLWVDYCNCLISYFNASARTDRDIEECFTLLSNFYISLNANSLATWRSKISRNAIDKVEAMIKSSLDDAKTYDGSFRDSSFFALKLSLGTIFHLTSSNFREGILNQLFFIIDGNDVRYAAQTQKKYTDGAKGALFRGYIPDLNPRYSEQSIRHRDAIVNSCHRHGWHVSTNLSERSSQSGVTTLSPYASQIRYEDIHIAITLQTRQESQSVLFAPDSPINNPPNIVSLRISPENTSEQDSIFSTTNRRID